MSTHAEKIEAAKRKAQEMKALAAAKRAAKEAAGGTTAVAQDTEHEKFLAGDHNLILIDWDDTLFPTSAWKDRLEPNTPHPLRDSKVGALSEAISTFLAALQSCGDVKIVTHGCKSWYEKSSAVLRPETKALLDTLPARYRDSHGHKYMTKKPAGHRYVTDIGSEVENYAEWYKTASVRTARISRVQRRPRRRSAPHHMPLTHHVYPRLAPWQDMFFHFVSERKLARRWDETHMPERVQLPRQVLVIGDGSAEKRSYDELGNQARLYATRPGHAAVANVGLKGVFYKDRPSFEELLLQVRWASANVQTTFLPAGDVKTKLWDLTGFPNWVCCEKVGANAYSPLSRGSIVERAAAATMSSGVAPSAAGMPPLPPPQSAGGTDEMDEDVQLQLALAASLQNQ